MSQKVKVCHLSTVHPSFDTRIFHKECKSLAQAGYDVTLIAQHEKNEKVDGIQIIGLPKPKNRIHRMLGLTFRIFLVALKQRADIYHFHDPELIPVGILLKSKGCRVIYDVHEDVPEDILTKDWIPATGRRIVSMMFKIFEKWTVKRLNFIVAATPFIYDKFLRLGCKVIAINNYPILDELCLPNTNWSKREIAVSYVGAICDTRGIFEMVKAIGQTDAALLLAGEFSPVEQRSQAVAMCGWNSVEEMGQLNRKEVARMLSRSMAGLVLFHRVPNHTNAQPNKIFEYMSAGIPVIASDFPRWKEIIEGKQCGICVNPMDASAIAEGIRWIIAYADEARRMGENGRRAVAEEYNWENESKKLLEVYERILK